MAEWAVGKRRVLQPENGWFNLDSGRIVKNPAGWAIRGLRFIGSIPNLQNFWQVNLLHLGDFLPRGATFESSIYQPGEDVSVLIQEEAHRTQTCFRGTAGTVIPAVDTVDVESLSPEQLSSLCVFSFAGIFSKAKVTHVIDGDTIDVVAYIPLMELGSARNIHRTTDVHTNILLSSNYHRAGFFAKIRLRVYGYDAIEHDKPEGQLATRLLTEKLNSLNNVIWCQFLGGEKYGRSLAILYENEDRTGSLNNYLIEKSRELGIRMAYPYTGGTKKQ
jgi:endonuclease YncB( thermonuclease family)